MSDTYLTLKNTSEGICKEKGSKFMAYGYPVSNEEEVKEILARIKKEHHSARHHCYAYLLGYDGQQYRINDDGEPSGTAGKPIYGQLLKYKLTNVLIVVVRYFGGTLLGTGGLIQAYKSATENMLVNADIIEQSIYHYFSITFSYEHFSRIKKILNATRFQEEKVIMKETCEIQLKILESEAKSESQKLQKKEGLILSDLGIK